MPIYNTGKKKDGLTKYRVRVNYTDELGKAHSMTRIPETTVKPPVISQCRS